MQKIFAACGARKLCGGIWDAGLGRSLRPVQTVDLAPASWSRATGPPWPDAPGNAHGVADLRHRSIGIGPARVQVSFLLPKCTISMPPDARATAATPSPTAVQLSEIIGAMSYALDLAEGRDCFVALTRAPALMPEPAAAA
jgi:hypothetical protein